MKKNSEISVFLESLEGGGAEQVLLTLINSFVGNGCKVEVILCRSGGVYQKHLSPAVNLVELHVKSLYYGFPKLVKYLKKTKPRILLTTLNLASMVALVAKRLARTNTRVIIRVANTISLQPKGWLKKKLDHLLQSLIYPWADGIIAVSDGVGDDLASHIGIPRGRIVTVYNPIITSKLEMLSTVELNHPWFLPDQPPVILGVGRLDVLKDFNTLIRAFDRLSVECPAHLLILGEGDQRGKLESLVAELNLGDKVSLPGFVENPFQYMKNAHVFVLSSISEGLPGVLIQALACGCPVVSTNCPTGPMEILQGGKYGHLVPVGDVEALAQAILQSLRGDHCRPPADWLDQFKVGPVVQQYLNIINGD
jgi:glycosyltransferase involved in cell wall biosynthesis